MASIYQRGKSNEWYLQYYVGGKKKRKKLNTDSRQIAEEMKRQTESSLLYRVEGQNICTLNVAGPRESKCPGGIYAEARAYLEIAFCKLKEQYRIHHSVGIDISQAMPFHIPNG